MSLSTEINNLINKFNNDVAILLKSCNLNIKNILNSTLYVTKKRKSIAQIKTNFNKKYKKLRVKLNLDIKLALAKAQAQTQAQIQAQIQVTVPVAPVPVPVPGAPVPVPVPVPVALVPDAPVPDAPVIINFNKNALLIGCNYIGTNNELYGCINDVIHIQSYLQSQYNFNNILIMTDNTDKKPTKQNILNEITNLLSNANRGDKLFLAFSGHGTTTRDTNGDEKDGLDELFIPLDFNYISDDEIKLVINNNLKKDVTLFALFDCCHSGTILDLRYQYFDSENYNNPSVNTKETETTGNIIMISGCRDNQTSADAYINSTSQGAMTWSFLDTLNKNSNVTWKELITTMRTSLKKSKYQQTPQLSSGKNLDVNSKFYLL